MNHTVIKLCNEAKISPSIIFAITPLTAFLTSAIFYFIYKESLKLLHYLGMIAMVFCVILIALSSKKSVEAELVNEESLSYW